MIKLKAKMLVGKIREREIQIKRLDDEIRKFRTFLHTHYGCRMIQFSIGGLECRVFDEFNSSVARFYIKKLKRLRAKLIGELDVLYAEIGGVNHGKDYEAGNNDARDCSYDR